MNFILLAANAVMRRRSNVYSCVSPHGWSVRSEQRLTPLELEAFRTMNDSDDQAECDQ